MQGWFNIQESVNVFHCINIDWRKIHIIISIDAGKKYLAIQNTFVTKTHTHIKQGIEGNFLKLINGIYENPSANHT